MTGRYSKEFVLQSGLPVFNYIEDDCPDMPVDFDTYSALVEMRFKLNEQQRVEMIKGFLIRPRMTGYVPLYSLNDVVRLFHGYELAIAYSDPYDE